MRDGGGLGYDGRNALTGKQRPPESPMMRRLGIKPEPMEPVKVPYQHGDIDRNDSSCQVNDIENPLCTTAFDAADFEAKKQRKFDVKMRDNSDPASDIPM